MPCINMSFEENNDYTKTVSNANSIGMAIQAMPTQAKWRRCHCDMWQHTLVQQDEYDYWYALSVLFQLFLLNIIPESCFVYGL